MIGIDGKKLNKLELEIDRIVKENAKIEKDINIVKAAELCNCSTSKISKFVKKLGFTNFKQYIASIYGKNIRKESTEELKRIRDFLDKFNESLVDELVNTINSHDKIILFGYGPSYICAQYFEYKLRFATDKVVIAVSDEISVHNLLDDKSLLIIISATGKFKSFLPMKKFVMQAKSSIILIIEEYNIELLNNFERIIFLTETFQRDSQPYEKSRTLFFIFFEEVIQCLLKNKKS